METVALRDGGCLMYSPAFLPAETACHYLDAMRAEIAWSQQPARFGYLQPRLTAAYGDTGLIYRYSGTVNRALPWTPALLEIKQQIETIQGAYNFCLLNRYRSGADSIAWHADDEPEMGDVIGSLSLGAERTFQIRHKITRETMSFAVTHGTLIIMSGPMQHYWQHQVPKTRRQVGERINLTFRMIRPPEPSR